MRGQNLFVGVGRPENLLNNKVISPTLRILNRFSSGLRKPKSIELKMKNEE
jgi:hypothetical protein